MNNVSASRETMDLADKADAIIEMVCYATPQELGNGTTRNWIVSQLQALAQPSEQPAKAEQPEWIACGDRLPTEADADEKGDVLWLRSHAWDCLGRWNKRPIDATAWRSVKAGQPGDVGPLSVRLQGIADHLRACPDYAKLDADADVIEQAARALAALSPSVTTEPFAWAIRWKGSNRMRGDVFVAREAAEKSRLNRFDPSAGEVVPLYLAPPANDGGWQHIANEWADVATNGLQWLRNVEDGTSTLTEAKAAMQRDIDDVRAMKRWNAFLASQQEEKGNG